MKAKPKTVAVAPILERPMKQTLKIYGWLPHKLNELMRSHWGTAGKRKAADRWIVSVEAVMQGITVAKVKRRVTVTITLGPRMRMPDVDAPHLKSLLDALVKAGLLRDDNPRWCELAPVQYERGKRRGVVIELEDLA